MTLRRHTTIGVSATHAMLMSYRGVRQFLKRLTGKEPNDATEEGLLEEVHQLEHSDRDAVGQEGVAGHSDRLLGRS